MVFGFVFVSTAWGSLSPVGEIKSPEICSTGRYESIEQMSLEEIASRGLIVNFNQHKYVKKILTKLKKFSDPDINAVAVKHSKDWKKYQRGSLSIRNIECEIPIKLRLTGDLLDHFDRNTRGVFHSIKVKMTSGSLDSVTAFKLFAPRSRGDLEEVFVTTLFQELGFLAPDTYKTQIHINGSEPIEVLLQEDLDVSFLERNSIPESILLEGDETLGLGLRKTLTRIINPKVLTTNLDHSIADSISRYLNQVYSRSVDASVIIDKQLEKFDPKVHPIFFSSQDTQELELFSALALATGTIYGISLDDSRFVFDKIMGSVRPIYYDGHPDPYLDVKDNQIITPILIRKEALAEIETLLREVDIPQLRKKLQSRGVTLSKKDVEKRLHNALANIADNRVTLSRPELINRIKLSTQPTTDYSQFQKVVRKQSRFEEIFTGVHLEATGVKSLTINRKARKINALLPRARLSPSDNGFTRNPMLRIFGGELSGWEINVTYANLADPNHVPDEIRGKLEYTGCLLFHDIKLRNVNVSIDNAPCEDAINLVRVDGQHLYFDVAQAASDAIDADFSDLRDLTAVVNQAGNDCVDFSFGSYSLSIDLTGCGDKGVSAGETSIVDIREGVVKGASIGVASKDGASVTINRLKIVNSQICIAEYRKKSKFNVGNVELNSCSCVNGDYFSINRLRSLKQCSVAE